MCARAISINSAPWELAAARLIDEQVQDLLQRQALAPRCFFEEQAKDLVLQLALSGLIDEYAQDLVARRQAQLLLEAVQAIEAGIIH